MCGAVAAETDKLKHEAPKGRRIKPPFFFERPFEQSRAGGGYRPKRGRYREWLGCHAQCMFCFGAFLLVGAHKMILLCEWHFEMASATRGLCKYLSIKSGRPWVRIPPGTPKPPIPFRVFGGFLFVVILLWRLWLSPFPQHCGTFSHGPRAVFGCFSQLPCPP